MDMPPTDDFERRAWGSWFHSVGHVAPLGPALRQARPSRTWRFHSHDSVRTPVTSDALAEASRRHRDVAVRVLGDDAECAVFCTAWEDLLPRGAWLPTSMPAEIALDEGLAEWLAGSRTWVMRSRNDDELFRDLVVPVFAGLSGARAAILSLETSVVLCPYDGGADVVMLSPEAAADARREFARWVAPA